MTSDLINGDFIVIKVSDVYDCSRGRVKRGKCYKCKNAVFNYNLYDRYRILLVYDDQKRIGFFHQACYEKWNPIIANCIDCKRKIRIRGQYEKSAGYFYCQKCYQKKQQKEQQDREMKIAYLKRNATPIIKKTTKYVLYAAPIGREIVLCYSVGKLMYSQWNSIYNGYQDNKKTNNEKIRDTSYILLREDVSRHLTASQSEITWNKIENEVPDDLKYQAKDLVSEVMSNVSEKELQLIEQAIRFI